MMTLSRKYFSGPTLTRALLEAARHHGVEADRIAYQVIDKKHGFVKTPRGVMIEVDPEAPTQPLAAEEAPVETPPVETPPAEAPPAETPPAQTPPAQTPPAEAPAHDAAPAPPERSALEASVQQEPAQQDREPAQQDPGPSAEPSAEPADADQPAWWSAPDEADSPESPEPPEAAESSVSTAATEATEATGSPEAPGGPELAAAEHSDSGLESEAASNDDRGPAPAPPKATASQPADEKTRKVVAEAVDELAHFAGLRVQVASVDQGEDGLEVELEGPDGGRLVAKGGRAILAIQHLLPRLLFHELGRATHCRVDCEGFHEARVERFARIAQKAAERVRGGGRPWMLEPMTPDERRLVHIALSDEPDIETGSVGEGFLKRVRVSSV